MRTVALGEQDALLNWIELCGGTGCGTGHGTVVSVGVHGLELEAMREAKHGRWGAVEAGAVAMN